MFINLFNEVNNMKDSSSYHLIFKCFHLFPFPFPPSREMKIFLLLISPETNKKKKEKKKVKEGVNES